MSETLDEVISGWDNYHSVNTRKVSEADIIRAKDLIQNRAGLRPNAHKAMLEEAITTSDFPYLFGQVIDRQLLANYKAVYADWRSYIKVTTVPDFNTVRREKLHGSDNYLDVVPEKGEYLPVKPVNCRYTYNVKKYGRQFDISWESMINDQLGAFQDIPQRFATAALRSEARFATSLYAASTGDGNSSLFGATITDCGQAVTNLGVLPLTIANLETTMELMAAQTDPNGEPIGVMPKHLVVPPALEFTARSILTSANKMMTYGGDDESAAVPWPTTNVIPQMGLQLHVDPYIPIIDTTHGTTSWYLFADPSQGAAMEMGFLRGHESPEIVMKGSDKVLVGGGAVSPFDGDFATDNVMYRVRHVFGGAPLDPRFAYLQSGA
ncbi:MAG: Mu-like prophage major head subunit gpT family protein [Methanoregula sp.]|jgi:hypothetical protein|nr:Mu-like prophage major head subunit gpT family protein [Methanoregula sp.]